MGKGEETQRLIPPHIFQCPLLRYDPETCGTLTIPEGSGLREFGLTQPEKSLNRGPFTWNAVVISIGPLEQAKSK